MLPANSHELSKEHNHEVALGWRYMGQVDAGFRPSLMLLIWVEEAPSLFGTCLSVCLLALIQWGALVCN